VATPPATEPARVEFIRGIEGSLNMNPSRTAAKAVVDTRAVTPRPKRTEKEAPEQRVVDEHPHGVKRHVLLPHHRKSGTDCSAY
jgi:hypothetical protein